MRNAMLLIQLSLSSDVLPSCFTCKFLNNRKFSIAHTKLVTTLSPWKACFTQQRAKAWVFSSDFTWSILSNSHFENYRNNFCNIKNSKWIIYPMRKGAANSKRMCIICHYLMAQNGDACTSFFDTLVGSVNNNARDQVRSVCPIHFSLDHSSDKLISFSTRNSILLLVYLRN